MSIEIITFENLTSLIKNLLLLYYLNLYFSLLNTHIINNSTPTF